jgi:hypothetical protein
MTPRKATESEWKYVRRWAKDDAVASVLLEIADRVAALEEASSELTGTIASADSDIEHRITALESQHNLAVDNITDLQGCANQLKAATSPPPAADHSRGATEMVATDEELCSLFDTRWLQDRSTIAALRAVYNLGRQHAAQVRQEDQPLPLPAPVTNPAAIGRFGEWLAREMPPGTEIGQPLHWAPRIVFAVLNACQDVEPTTPPAPAGGLVEELAQLLANRISAMPPGADCTPLARTVLCVVADAAEKWYQTPISHGSGLPSGWMWNPSND